MNIEKPYLLFLGDGENAKTAQGIFYWKPQDCVGQLRSAGCKVDLGLQDLSPAQAVEKGAKTLIIGVAPSGGQLQESWLNTLEQALRAGLNIASGLHTKVAEVERLKNAAHLHGRKITDVRHSQQTFAVADGIKRTGKRLLTVGTDCNVGKMFAALAIEKEMKRRGMNVDFRATGQTGIFIAGQGVSVDAVVSDFVSGATETLSPSNEADHWDIVEGQGSLHNASYAGVTLGLIHGSQPDVLVLCHNPSQKTITNLPHFPLPSVSDSMDAALRAARLTNPAVVCAGVCVNTSTMSESDAAQAIQSISEEVDLPCVDPVRTGVAAIVDRL
jgi:D-glutamate N-acetyltransferase